jgi:hypothetical protein
MSLSDRYLRPRAYDDAVYEWQLGRVPPTIKMTGKKVENPAFKHAIFVVHGMGMQAWTETAATLHSGFEDALEDIQKKLTSPPLSAEETPPPFIQEGFWADYDSLEHSFPEDWRRMEKGHKTFFSKLFKKRLLSPVRTFFWFFWQQLKLVNPAIIWRLNFFAWLLYLPLQVVSFTTLAVLLFRFPKVLAQVLGDVRLYVAPKGIIERAIVQRIDKRVGAGFLRTIGLDWDFKPLRSREKLKCKGKPIEFDWIVWVAHSLGTVISYNVLSDLFQRASEVERDGTPLQKKGVAKFRKALRRFVTLGSPLDKIAFMFGKDVLRPWPDVPRTSLLDAAETIDGQKDWWINFYHVLDPVSGALSNQLICGGVPPTNYHIGLLKIPGLAHTSYWRDSETLRYLLSRVYGKEVLPLPPPKPFSALALTFIALGGYLVWLALILGVVYLIYHWAPEIVNYLLQSVGLG